MKLRVLILSLLLVFTATSCSLFPGEYEYTSEEFIMDTFIKIKVIAKDEEEAKDAVGEAFKEFKRIELLTNRHVEEGRPEYEKSEIIKINKAAAVKPVKVDKDVFEMIQLAQEYTEATGGAFEITIGPVMDLWDFGGGNTTVPDEKKLEEALTLIGSDNIVLNEEDTTVFLTKKDMSLDLGAIAKGYSAQKATQVLKEQGIERAIINAGGNISVLGEKEKGKPWKIGVQDPRSKEEVIAILDATDQVIVTSGDYQRYFEANDKRYHHIIDPRTAMPARGLLSVTVIAEDSTIADILSTSFFVMGLDESLDYLEKHPDILAFFITDEKKIISSAALEKILEITESEDYSYDKGR